MDDRGGDSHAILEQICEAPAEGRLYVLIHNIDGPGITFSPLSLVDNLLRLVQSIGELFYVEGLLLSSVRLQDVPYDDGRSQLGRGLQIHHLSCTRNVMHASIQWSVTAEAAVFGSSVTIQNTAMWVWRAGLRSRETQQALSELSRCPAIRFLASVDHVNAALLWDKRTADRFNWLHFDATTYAPYAAETREIPSLLLGRRCGPQFARPCILPSECKLTSLLQQAMALHADGRSKFHAGAFGEILNMHLQIQSSLPVGIFPAVGSISGFNENAPHASVAGR